MNDRRAVLALAVIVLCIPWWWGAINLAKHLLNIIE